MDDPIDDDEQRQARPVLDRFERAFVASAEAAGVEVHRVAEPSSDEHRGVDGVLLSRRVLGRAERILLGRWDGGVLLGAWVHVARWERNPDWVYCVHLSRNRCHEVPEDPRTNGDGKDFGDLDWILRLVVAWVVELRDLWSDPLPRPRR